MTPLRRRIALCSLLVAPLACTTVHRPEGAPVTQSSLAAAIETIRASRAPVEILEDGLQADVYHYEWRDMDEPSAFSVHGGFADDPFTRYRPSVRALTGPRETVHLPYAWIEAVEARSWPLWAGVEIRVAGLPGANLLGPLVIPADDAEEAVRLSDAIDCLRRARSLPAPSAPEAPPADVHPGAGPAGEATD